VNQLDELVPERKGKRAIGPGPGPARRAEKATVAQAAPLLLARPVRSGDAAFDKSLGRE